MRSLIPIALVGVALLFACESDPTHTGCDPCPPPPGSFKSLTTREAVLSNLELSYNQRKITRLDELLDTDYAFFLEPGRAVLSIPEQWGRAEEMGVATLMFDPTLNDPRYPTCRRISMDLSLETGVEWIVVTPEAFPDETWYTATIFYNFTIEMKPDNTYIAAEGSSAEFTVRNRGTDDAPHWQLVEMRDFGDGSLAAGISKASQSSSWSDVKSLYR